MSISGVLTNKSKLILSYIIDETHNQLQFSVILLS